MKRPRSHPGLVSEFRPSETFTNQEKAITARVAASSRKRFPACARESMATRATGEGGQAGGVYGAQDGTRLTGWELAHVVA
jgi:hypothetical protein